MPTQIATALERLTTPTTPATSFERCTVIALYDTHLEAEAAVGALQKSGVDVKQVSIIGRDYHTEEQVVGYYTTGDRMKAWGASGAFWGGLWSMLFGSAFFMIPGIGPVLAAGPVVAWIVAALEGAAVVGGVSALGAGLFSMGIPRDSVLEYETKIKGGKFLVVVDGTQGDIDRAQAALSGTKHEDLATHSCRT